MICVCGGPGSGKTTYCHNVLKKEYPNAKIISLDGYHTYRKDLSED